jgi:formate hydrogenlyase subunit 3/multisubunit Na+/H+ antiporter MnhD subunit
MTSLSFQLLLWLALLWPLAVSLRVFLAAVVSRPGSPQPFSGGSPFGGLFLDRLFRARSFLERPFLDGLWCTAALPALLLALLAPAGELTLEWWLLGGEWALEGHRRPLLAFAALLWGLAGLYARDYQTGDQAHFDAGDDPAGRRLRRFALLWPLTLAGNLLLIVAEDIASFYLGFAVMTFCAYGLVVHAGSREARTGGLAYLVMAMLGEGLILAGLLWAAGSAGTTTLSGLRQGIAVAESGAWMGLVLWLGFGVKAGVIGLHLWLPLAHPVAPTPASAVLSGVMIKAGLLGWMATLPLGETGAGEALGHLGVAMLLAGLLAAFGAALYGSCQRHPKAVLAYSSISQMGMISALVAMGLIEPRAWPALSTAVVMFAAHHGLTKGALFLGVGIGEHPPRLPTWLLWTLLALPALSLAGVLGSGLAAKGVVKTALHDADHAWLGPWLSLAAVGTTLLMARTLWCQWQAWRGRQYHDRIPLLRPMPLAWLGALLAAMTLPWWLPLASSGWPPLAQWPGLLWPAVVGMGLAVATWSVFRNRAWPLLHRLPPGDLWWPLCAVCGTLVARGNPLLTQLGETTTWTGERLKAGERRLMEGLDKVAQGEVWLLRHAAVLMLAIALLLAMALLLFP